jgi:DNA-binding transcriptional regulator YdaS (Cro superfamily)
MTQTTLRAVTLETVANYRQMAEHAVGAYRASGHRLLGVMNRSVDRAAQRGAERIAPRLAAALRRTSGKVSDVAVRGIDTVSAQTERAIELGSASVIAQVRMVADLVEGIENRYVVTGLQAVARVSLGGAQAALTLSEKLVAGADKLSSAIEGTPTAQARRKVAVRGRAAAKTARRAVAPVQAEAMKQVKAVARRAKAVQAKVVAAKPQAKAPRSRRAA